MADREVRESDTGQRRADRSIFFTSPVLLALVGLIGTGVGAVLQGFWNTRLEREKFEFSLIQKALDTPDHKQAGRNLKFLVQAGLISGFDGNKIESLADTPNQLPIFLGTRSYSIVPVPTAKRALAHLGIYKGPINDAQDDEFVKAVQEFQKRQGLDADGFLGPTTAGALRREAPDAFN
jgi:Putative peptidoglycan binding domain